MGTDGGAVICHSCLFLRLDLDNKPKVCRLELEAEVSSRKPEGGSYGVGSMAVEVNADPLACALHAVSVSTTHTSSTMLTVK